MIKVRVATIQDVGLISHLHLEAFKGFFLTKLGFGFLSELYSGFVNHPDGILLVAEDDGCLVGFVAGTISPEKFFSDLRREKGFRFLFHAIPALLKQPLMAVPKLYSALFYAGDKPERLVGGALLSSIGLAPRATGKKIGQNLIAAYEILVFERGAPFVYLTTDVNQNDRANDFYNRNGYTVQSRFTQVRGRPMLRYIKEAPSRKTRDQYNNE